MTIINSKLTTAYVVHEAIESQKLTVNGPNHTVIYIGVGPMGVPVSISTTPPPGLSSKPTDSK